MKSALSYLRDEDDDDLLRITLPMKVQKLKERLNSEAAEKVHDFCDCADNHLFGLLVMVHCLESDNVYERLSDLSSHIRCEYLSQRLGVLKTGAAESILNVSKKAEILFG